MKIILCTVLFMFYTNLQAQLLPKPQYTFEYLNFYTKMSVVKNMYSKLTPVVLDDKAKKMLSNYGNDYIYLQYYDSLIYKNGTISIAFSKKDSLLNSVQFIMALSKDDESGEYEKTSNNLWEETLNRFGVPIVDKNIAFFGKVRKWEINKVLISVMKTESGFKSLILSYSLKE